jgi:hypothetical protein
VQRQPISTTEKDQKIMPSSLLRKNIDSSPSSGQDDEPENGSCQLQSEASSGYELGQEDHGQ